MNRIHPLLGFVATIGLAAVAHGADEVNVSRGGTAAGPGLAAHGYDVVAFFTAAQPTLGSARFSATHGGATYRFASAEHLAAFEKAPEKYAPAYGGYCAFGVSVGKKFDGDPRFWRIEDGRLYFNLNGDIQRQWLEDVGGRIESADAKWREIATRKVAAL
jgi:YHS domain-containing protein